jgi:uncharacterized sulfatase
VLSLDLAPTILAAAGIKPAPEMPGVDLRDEAAVARRKVIFGEIFTHNAVDIHHPASSLRYRWALEGDWKLILPDARNTPGGSAELYDLTSDPFETRNLAGREGAKVAHLSGLIDGWWNSRGE